MIIVIAVKWNYFADICNNSGRWKCPNQNKCLNQDSLCNSIFDCNDKADEHMEACAEACPNRGQLPCLAKGKP